MPPPAPLELEEALDELDAVPPAPPPPDEEEELLVSGEVPELEPDDPVFDGTSGPQPGSARAPIGRSSRIADIDERDTDRIAASLR